MKQNKTVLVTSAGVATAANVISALRRSSRYKFHIIAVDMDVYAAGLHLADQAFIVPTIKSPDYLEKILALVARQNVEFVFPLYSKEIALFAAEAEEFRRAGAEILTPRPDIVVLCDNKPAFLGFLSENDFSYPRTFCRPEEVTFPAFMKPPSGSSSANTFVIRDVEELAFYLAKYPDSIIQEFVHGREYTVDCLVDREQRVIAVVPRERLKVKDGKSVLGKTVRNNVIISEVRRLLSKLEMTGPCNVQLFFDGHTVRFVEVNPRLAAGGLPLAVEAGVNIPELMVRIADGERLGDQEFEEGVVIVRYLSDLFIREPSIAEA